MAQFRPRPVSDPALVPSDSEALREVARLLYAHADVGSVVPPEYLENLADRIDALILRHGQ
jgi:hypothetical protein